MAFQDFNLKDRMEPISLGQRSGSRRDFGRNGGFLSCDSVFNLVERDSVKTLEAMRLKRVLIEQALLFNTSSPNRFGTKILLGVTSIITTRRQL